MSKPGTLKRSGKSEVFNIQDLEKLRKTLKKGHRSTLISIKNGTSETLVRKPDPAAEASFDGKWVVPPPDTISPGALVHFGCVGKGVLAGSQGKVLYQMPGMDGEFGFQWNNGKEKEKRGWSWNVTDELKDSPYEVFEQGQGDKHQEIIWTITNVAQSLADSADSLPTPASSDARRGSLSGGAGGRSGGTEGEAGDDESKPKADDWSDDDTMDRKINFLIRSHASGQTASSAELKSAASAFKPAPVGGRRKPAAFNREDSWLTKPTVPTAGMSPKDLFKSAQQSLRTGLAQLEAGAFESALDSVNKAIAFLAALPDPQTRRREMKILSAYKIALVLLQEVKKTSPPPLPLLTFLATLPLRPEHRIVNARRLIRENMAVGNYEISARFLKALVPLNLKDSAELQVQLKVCEEKARTKKDDGSVVPEKNQNGTQTVFCWKTFKPLTGKFLSCRLCLATFSEEVAKGWAKCIICDSASLA